MSGSALVPSSVTTVPFTFTWPALINSSALRREAIPAAAIIFCRRSAGMCEELLFLTSGLRDFFYVRRFGLVCFRRIFCRNQLALERFRHELLKLFHAGQFVHVLQSKAHEKFFGRLVENRPPDDLLATRSRDQLPVQQSSNH